MFHFVQTGSDRVLIPVGERANEGVNEQLDESFGCEQQTNTNILFLQIHTVLKTGGVLQDRGDLSSESSISTYLSVSHDRPPTAASLVSLICRSELWLVESVAGPSMVGSVRISCRLKVMLLNRDTRGGKLGGGDRGLCSDCVSRTGAL